MEPEQENLEKELRAVWDAFAESIAESSDEEVLAEAREEGEDPHETAQRVRSALRDAVKSLQQRRLHEAEHQYKRRITEIYERQHRLPATPEQRRELLSLVFSRIPAMQTAVLTAQHREFSSLTDEDIESYLKQLDELGVLDRLGEPHDERRQ